MNVFYISKENKSRSVVWWFQPTKATDLAEHEIYEIIIPPQSVELCKTLGLHTAILLLYFLRQTIPVLLHAMMQSHYIANVA